MDEFEELPEITTGGSSAILSSLYRTILLSLGVNAPLFSKLIYKYCCKVMNSNTGKSFNTRNILRTKENALVKRLIEPKFSFDTFLIGLKKSKNIHFPTMRIDEEPQAVASLFDKSIKKK